MRLGLLISVIVLVRGPGSHGAARDGELLVRSLVWLVSAVVAGLVRDVTLAGPLDMGVAEIAEQSGCGAVEDASEAKRLDRAMVLIKQPRVLIIETAFQPDASLTIEIENALNAPQSGDAARLLMAPVTTWQRLLPGRGRTVGIFAPAARCRKFAARDFKGLLAGLRPKVRFVSRANPVL